MAKECAAYQILSCDNGCCMFINFLDVDGKIIFTFRVQESAEASEFSIAFAEAAQYIFGKESFNLRYENMSNAPSTDTVN